MTNRTPSHEFANGFKCYDQAPIIWANSEDCLHDYDSTLTQQEVVALNEERDTLIEALVIASKSNVLGQHDDHIKALAKMLAKVQDALNARWPSREALLERGPEHADEPGA